MLWVMILTITSAHAAEGVSATGNVGVEREYQQLKTELREELQARQAGRDPLKWQLLRAASRQKLLQFAFLDTFTPAVIQQLTSEPEGKKFIDRLRKQESWLEMLMTSGPIENPAQTLAHLAHLWKRDQACSSENSLQTLSVAVALEYGRRDWPLEQGWTRYAFYRDSQKLELLHPIYDGLEAWEKRYLTGHSTSMHGGAASQLWLRDNVKLPAEGYRGACWQLAYRLHNDFGDSVHGSMYYWPFQESFDSFTQMTRFVGGVCGRLSGYGAAAAVANGIPATTMGEPGHCAYTVRVARGEWKPAYSLSWKRGVHVRFYDSGSYNLLVLTEDVFSDQKPLKQAYGHLWQARLFSSASVAKTRAAYLAAIESQPTHYEAWRSYGDWLNAQGDGNEAHWEAFHQTAIKSYASYPEVAWMLISRYAYPKLLPKLKTEEKIRLLGEFHRAISGWGPNRWDFERVLAQQLKYIGSDSKDHFTFFQGLLRQHKDSATFAGPTLGWGQAHFNKSIDQRKQFISIATRTMSRGTGEDGEKALYGMANRLVLDAQKQNDAASFQLAGAMLKELQKSSKRDKPAFPGELLSEGAMVRTSGTSRYDTPWKHYFLPSRQSGFFHTGRQKNPWVEIAMKQFGEIRGIEVVNWARFHSRAVPLKVEVSEDGKTWQTVELLNKAQAVWKIDLKGRNVRGRYLRLTKQGNDFLHLNNVRVYGQRRS